MFAASCAGGTAKSTTNEIFLFSNAITQAIRTDLAIATDPKTRSGWMYKLALSSLLPKMLMMGATLGLAGEWAKRMLDKIVGYKKGKIFENRKRKRIYKRKISIGA